MTDKLKVLDLFSGIGGFSLGLERTGGFETVAFCEIEKFPQAVLRKHWPEVPIYEDVRTLTKNNGPANVDVICGGYPCQPFSTAGRRKGAEDDRHLWPEVNRLLAEYRPHWFIGENVAGHVSMGLDDVLSDLEKQDYTARAFVIPACAVNAPHRRDRVWVVAHATSMQRNGGKNNAKAGERQTPKSRDCSCETNVPNTKCERQQGQGRAERRLRSAANGNRKADFTITNGGWSAEPAMGRVANGVPDRMDRLKGLGNAVVPQIPELIGRAILESEAK